MNNINHDAWRQMIDEDISWLKSNYATKESSLEFRHVIECMEWLKTHQPNHILKCPVCQEDAGIQFTKGKGKPYVSCDKHKIQAISLSCYQKKSWFGKLFL